jgi:hypothetical protein
MIVGVIMYVTFDFIFRLILGFVRRSFKGDGAIDRRLADKPQKAEAQDARDKADQHPTREQASDHDECPLIRNRTSRPYLPDAVLETREPAAADYF